MVIFVKCTLEKKYIVFMGKDKYENDELLKYRLPTDIWFHVAELSSAHVYIRSRDGSDIWKDLESEMIQEMGQLVKDNSIHGRKKEAVNVHYTPAMNITKTKGMSAGQIHYVNRKKVKTIKIIKDRTIANRLKKRRVVKEMKFLDDQTEDFRREIRMKEREEMKKKRNEEAKLRKEKKKQEKMKSYSGFFETAKMESNKPPSKNEKKSEKGKKDAWDDSDSDSDSCSSDSLDSDDFM